MKQSTIALALLPLLFTPDKARTPECLFWKTGLLRAILLHPVVLAA